MGAGSVGTADVVVEADLFSVRSGKAVIGDLSPYRFAVLEFDCCIAIIVVFADRVSRFTAEDAADLVTLSAARWKRLVVPRGLPPTRGAKKGILAGENILRICGR